MYRQASSGGSERRILPSGPRIERFPGPVAIAAEVPDGFIAPAGFEDNDGRPWSVQIRFRDPAAAGRRVVVRTTRGSLDWTPVIGTVENVHTVIANCGARPVRPVVEEATSVEIGGETVPAVRVPCLDGDCALAFDWQGQHVYVVGGGDLVNGLRMRGADVADFEAYDAAHRARHPRAYGR